MKNFFVIFIGLILCLTTPQIFGQKSLNLRKGVIIELFVQDENLDGYKIPINLNKKGAVNNFGRFGMAKDCNAGGRLPVPLPPPGYVPSPIITPPCPPGYEGNIRV